MAKIFVCKEAYKADLKVFEVRAEYQADLLYFNVTQEYKSKGDGLRKNMKQI